MLITKKYMTSTIIFITLVTLVIIFIVIYTILYNMNNKPIVAVAVFNLGKIKGVVHFLEDFACHNQMIQLQVKLCEMQMKNILHFL